ncbi:MAG TPA: hemolysin family protein [Thermoanaerobaculia bacterium]|jgi:CBS domain containing-hemolysin-like protein|nr:hemolysin family protein [Thermoanaerobaculia bacterium]
MSGFPTGWLWLAVLTLPLAILLSILSALLERSGPIRLSHWAEEAGGNLRALYESRLRFGIFRSLLSLFARLAPIGLFLALWKLGAGLGLPAAGWIALGFVAVELAATETANRLFVSRSADRALELLTRAYRAVYALLLAPIALVSLLIPTSLLMHKGREQDEDDDDVSDEEIEAFIDVGKSEGILEAQASEWVWNVVDFPNRQAKSVMTPRIDMICAPLDAPLDTLADRFVESGHSRIPLYDGSIDKIAGVLHIRDLLRALRTGEPTSARGLVKPPLLVPETKTLDELLRELQRRFQQVAIVVDEHGGTAGLVTVEDLVEEIVGEIADEHEALAADLEPLGEGRYRLEGKARLDLLEEMFDVDFDDAEVETVGGLVLSVLGRVPKVGDTVEAGHLRFVVESMEDRRIQSVVVEALSADARDVRREEA